MLDPSHTPSPAPSQREPLLFDGPLDYHGPTGMPAHCRLRLYQHAGRHVAVLTEEQDNEGMSITNAAERVAARVLQLWELDPERTVFVEHYPASGAGRPPHDEHLHQVRFTFQGRRLTAPQWSDLGAERLSALIGRPWVSERYPDPQRESTR